MGAYNKGIVSLVMALILIFQTQSGIDLGLSEETVTAIIGAVWAVLVYFVPNVKRGENVQELADKAVAARLYSHWLATIVVIGVAMLLASCAGNILTGEVTNPTGGPITVPTGGCTLHFDGSWECTIGGAGGPVPEAVVPVEPAPPPVVEVPAEPVDQPSTEATP